MKSALAVSSDGKHVLAALQGGSLALWDTTTGAEVGGWFGHFGPVSAVVLAWIMYRVMEG